MFTPMTKQAAIEISSWTYRGEYACYSFSQNEETLAELLDGGCFIALDSHSKLYGYACFGKSAQIPTIEPNAYDEIALDIGLGLLPSLCGKGLGLGFLSDCIAFAQDNYSPDTYRLTVARFNKRAIKVYQKIGFAAVRRVRHAVSKQDFIIMHLPAQL